MLNHVNLMIEKKVWVHARFSKLLVVGKVTYQSKGLQYVQSSCRSMPFALLHHRFCHYEPSRGAVSPVAGQGDTTTPDYNITMLAINSAIHTAAGRRSAGGWNDPQGSFQPPAPFTAYGSFRNCTRQNHGMARNREASGFVNSAVTVLFTKLPASRFPAVP